MKFDLKVGLFFKIRELMCAGALRTIKGWVNSPYLRNWNQIITEVRDLDNRLQDLNSGLV